MFFFPQIACRSFTNLLQCKKANFGEILFFGQELLLPKLNFLFKFLFQVDFSFKVLATLLGQTKVPGQFKVTWSNQGDGTSMFQQWPTNNNAGSHRTKTRIVPSFKPHITSREDLSPYCNNLEIAFGWKLKLKFQNHKCVLFIHNYRILII